MTTPTDYTNESKRYRRAGHTEEPQKYYCRRTQCRCLIAIRQSADNLGDACDQWGVSVDHPVQYGTVLGRHPAVTDGYGQENDQGDQPSYCGQPEGCSQLVHQAYFV